MRSTRLTTVMGVARAVLATVEPRSGARVLVDEFGFDATLQALALLPDPPSRAAFAAVWTDLLLGPLEADLRDALGGAAAGPVGADGGPR